MIVKGVFQNVKFCSVPKRHILQCSKMSHSIFLTRIRNKDIPGRSIRKICRGYVSCTVLFGTIKSAAADRWKAVFLYLLLRLWSGWR